MEIDQAFVTEESILNFSKKETKSADDFWGTMREQRVQRESLRQSVTRERAPQRKGNIVSINNAAPSMPLSQEAKELQVGNIIQHERFGRGEVVSIELSGNDRRAFVEFESAGKKQLLLKFAKFNIIE
jgi:DNA helicase-2/ATP-dependent DNA helicase PcrA